MEFGCSKSKVTYGNAITNQEMQCVFWIDLTDNNSSKSYKIEEMNPNVVYHDQCFILTQ